MSMCMCAHPKDTPAKTISHLSTFSNVSPRTLLLL